ncbi:DUF6221 family protein [Streptomyces xanthochromogenes]|uniref:DUF6221 family protein n=1 Tax=Streptomyces xanthochromogenes TaxID=67384 RepID=UPI0037FD90C3
MDDPVQFLRDRYDDEALLARAAHAPNWSTDGRRGLHYGVEDGWMTDALTTADALHIARHDPARVLADIEAKRVLIARGGPFCTSDCDAPGNQPMDPESNWTTPLEHHFDCAAYEAAKVLTLPYAAHPDYREEWRP